MLIRIQRNECEKFDMVQPFVLDRLLESGGIKQFLRCACGQWVVIGIDRLRQSSRKVNGERRA